MQTLATFQQTHVKRLMAETWTQVLNKKNHMQGF